MSGIKNIQVKLEIFIVSIIYAILLYMHMMAFVGNQVSLIFLLLAIILTISVSILSCFKYVYIRFRWIYIFIIYVLICNILTISTLEDIGSSSYGILASFLLFLYGYNVGKENNVDSFINTFLLINIITFLIYFSQYDYFDIMQPAVRDVSFYIISFLPFVCFLRKRVLKIILIVLIGILLLLTAKRSVFIGYIIYIIIFLMLNMRRKMTMRDFFVVIFIAILVLISYNVFQENVEDMLGRFRLIEDDQGSGRLYLYESVLTDYYSSSSFSQLFGHGSGSVVSLIRVHAHNDFIEILYDYGLMGLFIFVMFLVSLFSHLKEMKNLKYIKAIYISSIFLYIILCSMNALLYTSSITMTLYMTMGICQGLCNNPRDL